MLAPTSLKYSCWVLLLRAIQGKLDALKGILGRNATLAALRAQLIDNSDCCVVCWHSAQGHQQSHLSPLYRGPTREVLAIGHVLLNVFIISLMRSYIAKPRIWSHRIWSHHWMILFQSDKALLNQNNWNHKVKTRSSCCSLPVCTCKPLNLCSRGHKIVNTKIANSWKIVKKGSKTATIVLS